MTKKKIVFVRFLFLTCISLFGAMPVIAQTGCPQVTATGSTTICPGACVTLNETLQATLGTTSYTVGALPYTPFPYNAGNAVLLGIDDKYTNVVAIPFNFCFYGTTYNQLVIGANGDFTFNLAQANLIDPWSQAIGGIPQPSYPSQVMCPYQDIDPSVGGTIKWEIYGSAPCRQFVISWYQVPMYNDNSELATNQVVLNETTNYIDVYGAGILGIQNPAGTVATVVAGRNSTQWLASNEGWRFAPAGAPSYTFNWFNGATNLGSSPSLSVCPTTTTTYTAQLINTNCDGAVVTLNSTATVTVNGGSAVAVTPLNPAVCGGGSVTLTATGGTTYSWSPSATLNTSTGSVVVASPTTTTTYTVTATTAGCTGTATTTVSIGTAPVLTGSSTPANCNGTATGTATVAASGGNPPYTYSWSAPGGASSTLSNVPAGTYTVTVSSAGGCSSQIPVTVAQPTAIAASTTQVNVLCAGGSTGSAAVTASGGTGPYTYSWTPSAQTGSNATNLSAGNYTCTVTDSKSCVNTQTVTLTEPAALALSTSMVSSSCGKANGSATVVATGGNGAYTYSWTPSGSTAATASSLSAGTYSVLVNDANGCSKTSAVTVTNSGGPTAVASSTSVSCNGGSNGTATVTVTGGAGPMTYSWTPGGANTSVVSNLSAGMYTVQVTDANTCITSASVTIAQPAPIAYSQSKTNITCNGACNGSISITPAGGSGPYAYSWTPGGATTAVVNGLCAGIYTCSVKDNNNCSIQVTDTLTQPSALTLSAAGIKSTCNGDCSGQLICIPAGGNAPYSYSWSTGCINASCTQVCAGTYSIQVTDAHSCTANATATVTQPTPLVIQKFPVAAHCNQADGSDSAFVSGGQGPYTYVWTAGTGSTAPTYAQLVPGTYTLAVKDANNCQLKDTSLVKNSPGVQASIVSSHPVTCFGGSNGSALAGGTGGTAPYVYSWTAPATGTADSATALAAGLYTCTIKDAKGCSSSATILINQPSLVQVTPMAPVKICIGQSTPLIATGTGGTPGYTYSWTLAGNSVPPPVSPTTTTTYTVVCTDQNGCASASQTVTVTVNPPIGLTVSPNAFVCPTGSTTLAANATGGNGQFTYTWSPALGLSAANISNPVASPALNTTYTVHVADNCGTPGDSAVVTVSLYSNPVINFSTLDTVGCAPLCANFTSTSAPTCQSAVWYYGDGPNSTGTGCGLAKHCYTTAGTYSVTLTVTDLHGCSTTNTIPNYITVYPLPEAKFSSSATSVSELTPTIQFSNASTGASLYTWNFGDLSGASSSLSDPSYSYPDTGCFQVSLVVQNSFGCLDTSTLPVCILPDFSFYAPNAFTPNGDGLNDVWVPKGIGIDASTYSLDVFDRWGNHLYQSNDWPKGWDGRANGGPEIAQVETYIWIVHMKDFHGKKHAFTGKVDLLK
jgi:gliding motility-associated-like protein